MNFSKSKYCSLWQCPKLCWLKKYKPEEETIDPSLKARFAAGNEVGDLAMGLFGKFVEVTTYDKNGKLDLTAMIKKTKQLLAIREDVICEASFSFNGLYCAVDILRRVKDGYAIYEVKSSTENNYVYSVDVAFQKYVLEKCGVKVSGTYLVNIDSSYVRQGELDINKLFKITDLSQTVAEEEKVIETNLEYAEKLLASDEEPNIDIDMHCATPYDCSYWNYCTQHLPAPSVFDLYRLSFSNKIAAYKQGIVSFEDIMGSNLKVSENQKRQIEFVLEDKPAFIDRDKIKEFLSTLTYPLYFLDFETMQPVIPLFDNTKPYSQIPFQYSLHYIESEGGELKHKEFLAESGKDPRRAIAESLCNDIPQNVCTLAYHASTEQGIIKKLADTFPDLSERLLNIQGGIVDLLPVFQKGYYYNKAMGGSFSIKSVLPALFPDDPALNYHNLEGVHNGSEAMDIFPRIKDIPKEEAEEVRRNLLKYCELDTIAMVKVWEELLRVVK